MNKKTDVFPLLFLTLIAVAATKYLLYKAEIENTTMPDIVVQEFVIRHNENMDQDLEDINFVEPPTTSTTKGEVVPTKEEVGAPEKPQLM